MGDQDGGGMGAAAARLQGYFNTRRGQVGDVIGGGPEATYDLGLGAGPQGSARVNDDAPGTDDSARYTRPSHGSLAWGAVCADPSDERTRSSGDAACRQVAAGDCVHF